MKNFFDINNKCGMDLSNTEHLYHDLGQFAQQSMGFKAPPTLNLVSDKGNSTKPLGKTAHYNPELKSVTIYTDNRHTKDILRSLAHELVHHLQNEEGRLDVGGYHGEGYAQKNKNLRASEREAYEKGNMCFRDWEDQLKQQKPTIYNERSDRNMSTEDWKNKELSKNLTKRFGLKMDLSVLREAKDADSEDEEASEEETKDDKKEQDEEEETEPSGKKGKLPKGLQDYMDNKEK